MRPVQLCEPPPGLHGQQQRGRGRFLQPLAPARGGCHPLDSPRCSPGGATAPGLPPTSASGARVGGRGRG
eukprot:8159788-Alexandrium_andersonii.AAC.1